MPKDLILLVADKDIDYGIRGLVSRPQALLIRPIEIETYVHPRRDPGCAREAESFLRPFIRDYKHAMVVFDHHGCGRETVTAEAVANDVSERLARNGWNARAAAIVLDPELETWTFSSSPNVEKCLRWKRSERVRVWLEREGLWDPNLPKPTRPKEAFMTLLREAKQPHSAAIYECLGMHISVTACVDATFARFRRILADWFPQNQ